jgi:putative phosphoribosyl transferase
MFRDKTHVFRDRTHAGMILADLLERENNSNTVIIAIPNGGVPVALPIYNKIQKKNPNTIFHLLIVRKIPIPYNTEAGFGAITIDGTVILNEPLVQRIGLTEGQIQNQVTKVMAQMKHRLKEYGISSPKLELEGKNVIIVDDGLASGFTMIAAVKSIQKFQPQKIIIAVPTAPQSSVDRVSPFADQIVCPNVQNTLYFAVANAYKNWYDLEIAEVRELLQKANLISPNAH